MSQHEILVLIVLSSNEGSGEPAQMGSRSSLHRVHTHSMDKEHDLDL